MNSKTNEKTTKPSASKSTSPRSVRPRKPKPNVVIIEPCDKCPKADFKSTAERGRHMLHAHGIPGSSPTALLRRKAKHGKHTQRPTLVETHQLTMRPGSQARGQVGTRFMVGMVGELVGQFREIIRFRAEQHGISKYAVTDQVCEGLRKDLQTSLPSAQTPPRPVTHQ